MKQYVSFISFLLIVSCAFAARPFSVEDSGVLDKGFEMELGYTGSTVGNSLGRESEIVFTSAAWNGAQIGISKGFFHEPDHSFGTGDTGISLKQALAENTALALSGSVRDGDDKNGFSSKFHEYSATLAHDLVFGNLTLFNNVAYTTYDKAVYVDPDADDENTKNNFGLGFGAQYQLTKALAICAETTKQVVQGDYLDRLDGQVIGMLGVVYSLDGAAFDFSYTSLPEEKDYIFSVGATVSL